MAREEFRLDWSRFGRGRLAPPPAIRERHLYPVPSLHDRRATVHALVTFVPTPREALTALAQRFRLEPIPGGRSPVFILASSWRSGSTLMQRLIMSTGEYLVWGEPYDLCGVIEHQAESVRPFTLDWPPLRAIADPSAAPTPDQWVANTYPHPRHLVGAHRAFFDRLFQVPALEAGFDRWGVKSVRLDRDHAGYLQWLYPDARFIVVHRNPFDAYRSFRRHHGSRDHSGWFWKWPHLKVTGAGEFATMWATLTDSLTTAAPDLGAVVAPYEEFAAGRGLDRVEDLVGAGIDRALLDRRIGGFGVDAHDPSSDRLTAGEVEEIRDIGGPVVERLGYRGPS
jgi:hypothetical protein